MKISQLRQYLQFDRSALQNPAVTKAILEMACDAKAWNEFTLTNDYAHFLLDMGFNMYECAHASFRRNYSNAVIIKRDPVNLELTFLDGRIDRYNSYVFYNKFLKRNAEYYSVERKSWKKRYFSIVRLWKSRKRKPEKRVSNYQLATNKLGDFIKS